MTTTAQLISAEREARIAGDALNAKAISTLDLAIKDHEARLRKLEAVEPLPSPTPAPSTGTPLVYAPTPNSSAPALGQSITEAGVKVTCVSTTTRHAYPLTNPWNLDGTRLMLNFSPAQTAIHDGMAPYGLRNVIQVPTFAFWSTTDPHTIYGANGTQLVKVSDQGGPFQTVHDFGATVSIGNYEGGVSSDGCIALTSGGMLRVWDVVNNRQVSAVGAPAGMDGFFISRSGQYVVIRGGTTRVYDRGLQTVRQLDPLANHGACCLIDGEDYYVGNNSTYRKPDGSITYGVVAFRLADGKATLLGPTPNAFSYGHVGGYGPRPTLSNYDATKVTGQPGRDQLVAVNLDGTVIPFGFAHHLTPDLNDGPTYRRQPHAVSDASGKRILAMGWDSACAVWERP